MDGRLGFLFLGVLAMWRRIACSLALGWISGAAVTGFSQECKPRSLFSTCQAIQLEIVLGRLYVFPRHGGQVRAATVPDEGVTLHESLVVNNDGGSPLVRYQHADDGRTMTVEVEGGHRISICGESSREQASESFEFFQPERGDLRLVVRDGAEVRDVSAPTIWHLLLSERWGCSGMLAALDVLRPDWNLMGAAEQLETEMFQMALAGRPISRVDVERLVAQLNAPEYQVRQSADRQLRSHGPIVLFHLDRLELDKRSGAQRLSGEQRARIQQIRSALMAGVGDTPRRVAEWLADDEQVWLALLKDGDPQRRQLAASRLAAIHPTQIQFDPYGEESRRQEQLARLRLQFGRR
jgi:hypothetical protein